MKWDLETILSAGLIIATVAICLSVIVTALVFEILNNRTRNRKHS